MNNTTAKLEEITVGKTEVLIGNELVEVTIVRNANGNLELRGIGSITCEWYNEELCLYPHNPNN